MKNVISLSFLSMLFLFLIACTKDDGNIENPNEQGLTSCPINSNCQYYYTNNADIAKNTIMLSKGEYRVFTTELRTEIGSNVLYIKAPIKGNTFVYSDDDIKNGKAIIFDTCPSCFSVPATIVGGSSRGKRISAANATTSEKWLVETTLKLSRGGVDDSNQLYIKQYYYPKP
jgi:hypothetical protein